MAAAPDCVSYMAIDRGRHDDVIDDFCRLLAAGINVDTTTHPVLVHPDGVVPGYAADPHYRPADGWCTRADETRSVVVSFGWIDAFNDGRS